MTADDVGLLVGAMLLVVGSFVVRGVVVAAAEGRLRSNALAGMRTTATRSSEEAWRAGHAAGRRAAEVTAVVSAVPAVAAGVLAVVGGFTDVVGGLVLAGAGVLLAGVVASGVRADRAAREVQRSRGER